jgi:hypothetical protein
MYSISWLKAIYITSAFFYSNLFTEGTLRIYTILFLFIYLLVFGKRAPIHTLSEASFARETSPCPPSTIT